MFWKATENKEPKQYEILIQEVKISELLLKCKQSRTLNGKSRTKAIQKCLITKRDRFNRVPQLLR